MLGTMKIHMPPAEIAYLTGLLRNTRRYLEYGSGGSTTLANSLVKEAVISVESDPVWRSRVLQHLPFEHKVRFVMVDLETQPESWGHPGPTCSDEKKRVYSRIANEIAATVDTVLIDGRFRAACALNIHGRISDSTHILIDDFFNRLDTYGVVLDYYDVVHRIGNMGHLRRKPSLSVPLDVIAAHELVAN